MERSAELEQLVRDWFAAASKGDASLADIHVSRDPSSRLVGSDPSEWIQGGVDVAAFLAVLSVLPGFVTASTPLSPAMAYFLGGTSVLIVVGVAMDIVDKLNAQLVMRNYEGFMGPGGNGGGGGAGWTTKK